MSHEVVVIDYGVGNIFSVRRAFEFCGAKVVVSDDPQIIFNAQRLVLPGVGAFADGMQGLADRGLDKIICDFASTNRPLLGICLGMQMLTTMSEEFGNHSGLGIIPGKVIPLPKFNPYGDVNKVPFVGWADLQYSNCTSSWQDTILDDINAGESVYLTHSYSVLPNDLSQALASCNYAGSEIFTAIKKEKIYGVQFHPEKSGPVGLRIIRNFSIMN